jgi:hypothetical protein
VENRRPWRPEFGPEGRQFVPGNSFFYFVVSSEAAMGGVGAQRPVWHAIDPKKTGALCARARTRGQNPLVDHIRRQQKKGGRLNLFPRKLISTYAFLGSNIPYIPTFNHSGVSIWVLRRSSLLCAKVLLPNNSSYHPTGENLASFSSARFFVMTAYHGVVNVSESARKKETKK